MGATRPIRRSATGRKRPLVSLPKPGIRPHGTIVLVQTSHFRVRRMETSKGDLRIGRGRAGHADDPPGDREAKTAGAGANGGEVGLEFELGLALRELG